MSGTAGPRADVRQPLDATGSPGVSLPRQVAATEPHLGAAACNHPVARDVTGLASVHPGETST